MEKASIRNRLINIKLWVIILCIGFIAGCQAAQDRVDDGKINVVASFYAMYDFARAIGGDHAAVSNLIPAGVDPHDWTPKSRDMTRVANADLFIYNGAGFEGWVGHVLKNTGKNDEQLIVEASSGVELIQTGDRDSTIDPHTWVSPLSALVIAQNIRDGYVAVDPVHRADYVANYERLSARLHALHEQYVEALSPANLSTNHIVVTHQSFGYLARDYGLTQIAIMGLSPDAEPTSRDLQQISNLIREHRIKGIFFEELISDRLATMLANDLGIESYVLNPLEGLTAEEQRAGDDYVSVMERNLQNILMVLQ